MLVQAAMRLCSRGGSGASALELTFEPNALVHVPHTVDGRRGVCGVASHIVQRDFCTAVVLCKRPRHTHHSIHTVLTTAVQRALTATVRLTGGWVGGVRGTQTHEGVRECEMCGVATFCAAHERRVRESHRPVCAQLHLALRCEQACAATVEAATADDIERLRSVSSAVRAASEGLEGLEFGSGLGLDPNPREVGVERPFTLGWDENFITTSSEAPSDGPARCQLAQTLSLPLTLAHAVMRLRPPRSDDERRGEERLVVHVLGAAAYPEMTALGKWEHALHALPHVRSLELVMVGPDAVPPPPSAADDDASDSTERHVHAIPLCRACRNAGASSQLMTDE